jgi:PadR family transcriptional regulator
MPRKPASPGTLRRPKQVNVVVRGLDPVNGLWVSRRIEQTTGGPFIVQPGSLFPALRRLEEAGWLVSDWQPSENNRRAKYYTLTKTVAASAGPGSLAVAARRLGDRVCARSVMTHFLSLDQHVERPLQHFALVRPQRVLPFDERMEAQQRSFRASRGSQEAETPVVSGTLTPVVGGILIHSS